MSNLPETMCPILGCTNLESAEEQLQGTSLRLVCVSNSLQVCLWLNISFAMVDVCLYPMHGESLKLK